MLSAEHFARLVDVLKLDSLPALSITAGETFTTRHVPPFPPDAPALITGIESESQLEQVLRVLSAVYPPQHVARLVRLPAGETLETSLQDMHGSGWSALYLPALTAGTSFEAFQEIIAHLRAPDGCPWDREQTHQTLRKHLIEESYETLAALDANDPAKMREEFGDLLLQIVLHAQVASEAAAFTMNDVLKGIYDKIIRRHPHVFGEAQADEVEQVLTNWERIKKEERRQRGDGEKSLLDGLPAALPALLQAQEYQDRAARMGFDWPEIEGVLDKIREEIEEMHQAADPDELASELGDLFFALVNLARWKKIDAEAALRQASQKFKGRFHYVEKRAQENGLMMKEASLQELDALWNEAKAQRL